MNKITIALSALALLAAGSAGAMAAPANGVEPNGRPINVAQLPSRAAESNATAVAGEPDFLSLWANEGAISGRNADQIRTQLKQKGLQPGTFAYDQQAATYAFPNQNPN